jgi:hypothetical protein
VGTTVEGDEKEKTVEGAKGRREKRFLGGLGALRGFFGRLRTES